MSEHVTGAGGPVGILGGTFDPVHHGHLRLALELSERLNMAQVHLVPAAVTVHRRQPLASGAQRRQMLEAAVAGDSSFRVDDRELVRGGPSYMVDTLSALRAELGSRSLCLMLGMDAFSALETWSRWERLLALTHIAVARRPGASAPADGPLAELLAVHGGADAAEIAARPAGSIAVLDIPALDISSTRIRELIAAGRSARYLLPSPVLGIIESEDLYAHAK